MTADRIYFDTKKETTASAKAIVKDFKSDIFNLEFNICEQKANGQMKDGTIMYSKTWHVSYYAFFMLTSKFDGSIYANSKYVEQVLTAAEDKAVIASEMEHIAKYSK